MAAGRRVKYPSFSMQFNIDNPLSDKTSYQRYRDALQKLHQLMQDKRGDLTTLMPWSKQGDNLPYAQAYERKQQDLMAKLAQQDKLKAEAEAAAEQLQQYQRNKQLANLTPEQQDELRAYWSKMDQANKAQQMYNAYRKMAFAQ